MILLQFGFYGILGGFLLSGVCWLIGLIYPSVIVPLLSIITDKEVILMFEKLKSIASKVSRKTKALFISSIAVISYCAMAVAASAAETPEAVTSGSDMETMMADAGAQLTDQFSSLVTTIIPVIIGILGSGLVIFGIFDLIKLAKKIFGKVAS